MSFSTRLFDEMSSVRLDDKSREFSILLSVKETNILQYKIDGLSKEQVLEAIASQQVCEDLLSQNPEVFAVSQVWGDDTVSLDMVYKDDEPWFADQEK